MDFEYTDEQRLLAESLERFVSDRYDFETRHKALLSDDGWDRGVWQELADMGLLGLPFSEEDGGFGGSGVDTMIVMQAMGKCLSLEPYFATAILAGGALRAAASPEQKAMRIPALIAGEHIMALAHQEKSGPRYGLSANTRARRDGDGDAGGWVMNGHKISVIHGASAAEYVVSAATEKGVSLFLVPRSADGISVHRRKGYDGVPVAELVFHDVRLGADALLGDEGAGEAVLNTLLQEANAALVAEAVGVMDDTVAVTAEYLKTRTQFGVSISTFQALQHRAVDMLIALELSKSMAILAALSLPMPAEERRNNVAAAKAQIGNAGRFIGQQAVQMHGAIGITAEYKVGHAFKRLTAIDALFGDVDHQIDVLVDAGGLMRDAA